VIHPLEKGLIQAAPWAAPGRFIQNFDLGLDAADKQKEACHHGCTPGSGAAAVEWTSAGFCLQYPRAPSSSHLGGLVNTMMVPNRKGPRFRSGFVLDSDY
jgi:hypothetical protein